MEKRQKWWLNHQSTQTDGRWLICAALKATEPHSRHWALQTTCWALKILVVWLTFLSPLTSNCCDLTFDCFCFMNEAQSAAGRPPGFPCVWNFTHMAVIIIIIIIATGELSCLLLFPAFTTWSLKGRSDTLFTGFSYFPSFFVNFANDRCGCDIIIRRLLGWNKRLHQRAPICFLHVWLSVNLQ